MYFNCTMFMYRALLMFVWYNEFIYSLLQMINQTEIVNIVSSVASIMVVGCPSKIISIRL